MRTRPTLWLGTLAISLLSAGAGFAQQAAQQPAPAAARGRGAAAAVVSPEILQDQRVTFRLSAPKATEVTLSGGWEGGSSVAMQKDEKGVWSVTVGPIKPEFYTYSFTVDGVRALDPGNADHTRDGSRVESSLIIPGPESSLFEHNSNIPHGTVSHVWYTSPTLKMTRRMFVYTPPGYEDSNARYPVFYLHHGGGGDEAAWTILGRLPEIMDNLIAAGKAKPMIVVMPNMYANQWAAQGETLGKPAPGTGAARPAQSTRAAGTGAWPLEPYPGSYAESIAKDIIPYIEKHYRVDARAASRAIAGLSMGGGPVALVSNNNPKMFGYVGLYSARPMADENQAKAFAAMKAGGLKLYYFSAGTTDFANAGVKALYELATKTGLNTKYLETPGPHSWPLWRVHVSDMAPLLFR